MHGPRLSSGSQSRRRRRKTVTWDENCDVVEISADEHETDSDEKEEQMGMGGDYEEDDESDPFFHGTRPQNEEMITDELSYENSDSHDVFSDDGSSLALDPDASISGLVEEMFASSSGKIVDTSLQNTVGEPSSDAITSTPPLRAIGSHFPSDINTQDRISPRPSHHVTESLQHRGECSSSPKPSPPRLPAALADGQVFNLPTHTSHGPSATPPRRYSAPLSPGTQAPRPFDALGEVASGSASSSSVGSPAPSMNVCPSHVVTPPLLRSTPAERHLLAREEDREDILMLPGTPSPSKIAINSGFPDTLCESGLIPEFEVDIDSSGM
ncbi:hypothetical protein C0992_000092 [Termitomyces sp. T32_za158]|nr:hypothetical protein C0992_000092 [Termitomyces sp. T32_za158]